MSRLTTSLAATALLGSLACQDATAPQPVSPPPSAEVLAALADLDERVVPALAPDVQSPMRAALLDVRNALIAGDAGATRRALAVTRRLAAGADADLANIALVADAAERSLEVTP